MLLPKVTYVVYVYQFFIGALTVCVAIGTWRQCQI